MSFSGPMRRPIAETASARAVVLVEGVSDQLALEALAKRRGRNFEAEGVSIVPMGGATNISSFLNRFGPQGLDLKLAGLCDSAEEGDFRRGTHRGRKIQSAALLVDALDLARVPQPLDAVLAYALPITPQRTSSDG